MAASAIVLVLLSAGLHVGWNLLMKSSADPRAFSAVKGIPLLALAGLVLAWLPDAALPVELWLFVIVSGVIHTVYIVGLSTAYVTGDLSLVYPIARSAPAFVPLAAFFALGERLSFEAVIGIGVVVAFMLLLQLSSSGDGWRVLLSPRGLARNRWALLTLASVVGYSLTDKAGMDLFRDVDTVEAVLRAPIYFVLENGLCYALYWVWMAARGFPGVRETFRTEWKSAWLAAAGGLASYSLILHVFQSETVSSVVALRQASVLIAVLVGWLWLGETVGRLRVISATGLLAGLAIVALAS